LVPIPDSVSFDVATMTEPTAVAAHALIGKKTVNPGDIVLVQGCGTIGMVHAIVAKSIGAGKVILTGTEADEPVRLPIAGKLGFDHVVNIDRVNLKDFIMDLTNGKGVDTFVDCSGSPAGLYATIELTKKAGNIVAIGEPPQPDIEFPWLAAVFRACTVYFSLGSNHAAWKQALRIMEQIDYTPMITHRLPIDEYRKGFQLLDDKEALKVILLPD
jgi:L-iditol 2-dehydrogenase